VRRSLAGRAAGGFSMDAILQAASPNRRSEKAAQKAAFR
jgi:hypothetical protein